MSLLKRIESNDFEKTTMDQIIEATRKALDDEGLKYDCHEDGPVFSVPFKVDNTCFVLLLKFSEYRMRFVCVLDFKATEVASTRVIQVMNQINEHLSYGAFYLESEDRYLVYDYGLPIQAVRPDPRFIDLMIGLAVGVVAHHYETLKEAVDTVSAQAQVPALIYS